MPSRFAHCKGFCNLPSFCATENGFKDNLRIDGDRLWESLMELARIGATEKGGVCRLALTDLDKEGRDLFIRWCEELDCPEEYLKLRRAFSV